LAEPGLILFIDNKELASKPIRALVNAVTSSSTAGSIESLSPALGSVVGWPSLSSAQPSGIGLPSWAPTGSMCHAAAPK